MKNYKFLSRCAKNSTSQSSSGCHQVLWAIHSLNFNGTYHTKWPLFQTYEIRNNSVFTSDSFLYNIIWQRHVLICHTVHCCCCLQLVDSTVWNKRNSPTTDRKLNVCAHCNLNTWQESINVLKYAVHCSVNCEIIMSLQQFFT